MTSQFRDNLSDKLLEALAMQLGVSAASLKMLRVGWFEPCNGNRVYTFPEFDGNGHVAGIATREPDGTKSFLRNGRRGLYLPRGWYERPGPILIVEGASDTAALVTMGLAGVGRPSATGGVEHLATLLAEIPDDRAIVVMGECDPKSDGRWPGRDGAKKAAKQLAELLCREISWTLPPNDAKDVRTWLRSQEDQSTVEAA